MPTALFIGRFQPLHKGHIAVIKNLMKKYDKVLVGIGSAENYQFDEVITGSDWIAKCFEGKKPVKKIKYRKGETLNGTNIRRLMLEGNKEWEKLVDKKVANYLKEIALRNFLQSLPS